jgi:hypothetical protein
MKKQGGSDGFSQEIVTFAPLLLLFVSAAIFVKLDRSI